MLVYRGKINWYEYAVDEPYTLVLPNDWTSGAPLQAIWQWTVDGQGVKKVNVVTVSTIKQVALSDTSTAASSWPSEAAYYTFETSFSSSAVPPKTIDITMINHPATADRNGKSTFSLELAYSLPSPGLFHTSTPGYSIFVGKITWGEFTVNNPLIVIVPDGVKQGGDILILFQWDNCSAGKSKGPVDYKEHIQYVNSGEGGSTEITVKVQNWLHYGLTLIHSILKLG
ncbi:hypothetical protein DL96DRAFT_1781505 [Flagelloscypha sp. PMI_526]|nr:hypothetical protein DL96DRAFT_1781505 [Flagelloscypha sp. PMI_526]